jgi:ATP-dependent DNA ligase
MPSARLPEPFDHEDWIFEPKLDGFRALRYIENRECRRRLFIARLPNPAIKPAH